LKEVHQEKLGNHKSKRRIIKREIRIWKENKRSWKYIKFTIYGRSEDWNRLEIQLKVDK